MTWIQRYRLRHFLRNSFWMSPVLAMAVAIGSGFALDRIEWQMRWKSDLDSGAIVSLLGTLAGSMLTFVVFLSSTLLLVLQLASAQLSPRIVGVVFRNRVFRCALVLFTFLFTFTLVVLVRIHDPVPTLMRTRRPIFASSVSGPSSFWSIIWPRRCGPAAP